MTTNLQLRHILFPYDFSTQGRQALPFVRALAGRTGSRITLFSVVPPAFELVPVEMGGAALRAGDSSEAWKRELQQRLDRALVTELAGLDVTRVADAGDPAFRIADYATHHDVDLVMMPTHGLGLFRNLLVGSVTLKVLHDAQCPVWTAAHTETQTAPETPRTILCAIDGGAQSVKVMQYAAAFGAAIGAGVAILHVVPPISDWPSAISERHLQDEARDSAEERIAALVKEAGVAVAPRVAVGEIVETTTEQARQDHADLLIIGRGAAAGPFARLRTHAFGIVQASPCPVLSVA
jgi:nucleotide-binding universal stress UspA family protein